MHKHTNTQSHKYAKTKHSMKRANLSNGCAVCTTNADISFSPPVAKARGGRLMHRIFKCGIFFFLVSFFLHFWHCTIAHCMFSLLSIIHLLWAPTQKVLNCSGFLKDALKMPPLALFCFVRCLKHHFAIHFYAIGKCT